MKMKYTDEATFITEDVEIPDDQVMIAKKLHDKYGNYGPVIIRNDKKSLCFAINEDKKKNNLYRITIEKV